MDGITKAIVICICTLIAATSGCTLSMNYQDNSAIESMVKSGADPLDAFCAVRQQNSSPVCSIRAAEKLK